MWCRTQAGLNVCSFSAGLSAKLPGVKSDLATSHATLQSDRDNARSVVDKEV